jgi:hypothetical protein
LSESFTIVEQGRQQPPGKEIVWRKKQIYFNCIISRGIPLPVGKVSKLIKEIREKEKNTWEEGEGRMSHLENRSVRHVQW